MELGEWFNFNDSIVQKAGMLGRVLNHGHKVTVGPDLLDQECITSKDSKRHGLWVETGGGPTKTIQNLRSKASCEGSDTRNRTRHPKKSWTVRQDVG